MTVITSPLPQAPIATSSRTAWTRPTLRTLLVDIAPAIVAYYGLRAAGASAYLALLAAAVVAGVHRREYITRMQRSVMQRACAAEGKRR
jgi:hypothetical protein